MQPTRADRSALRARASPGARCGPLLAACLALAAGVTPVPGMAEEIGRAMTATAAPDGSAVMLEGASPALATALCDGDAVATLRADGRARGVPVAVPDEQPACAPGTPDAGALTLRPRFPLLPGMDHEIALRTDDGVQHVVALPAVGADAPSTRVAGVWPEASVLPANTLRFYVIFDRPMARGSAGRDVRLETAAGEVLTDVFLNLGVELWSSDQTRLTLMLDPGRIKRGVGPSETLGAPLSEGMAYRLVVDGAMRDARGRPLGIDHVHRFRAGAAERRAIGTGDWRVTMPAPNTRAPLHVAFDRVIDRANATRALAVLDAQGQPVSGVIDMADRAWIFTPHTAWSESGLSLRADARLEDAAGNTLCHAFDVDAGAGAPCREAVVLPLR